jgi:hypothetical protein
LVSVSPDNQQQWEAFLQQQLGNAWQQIGVVAGKVLNINSSLVVSLDEMRETTESAIASSIQ